MNEFKQVAKVSRQTVYKWIAMGLLSDQHIGRNRLFTQEDVDKAPEIKKMMSERTRGYAKN